MNHKNLIIKKISLTLVIGLYTLISLSAQENKPLFATGNVTAIYVDKTEKQVVHTAVALLQQDVKTVFDAGLSLSDNKKNAQIIAGTIGINKDITHLAPEISGKWEAFSIKTVEEKGKKTLYIIGSDPRGTAYGILELSRMFGVSPWAWWGDVTPEKATVFPYPSTAVQESPSVKYRGIFLNDEDWGLLPWSSKTFEPGLPTIGQRIQGAIGPETYGKIFELLLRLRANTIWPAMHECTVPFYLVEGNRQVAEKYGIVVGTSHCEPLMRNSATEWDVDGKGEYNYLKNEEEIQRYWTDRLKELSHSENIFTIGMRGKHDGMMQGVKTTEEYKNALIQVIAGQTGLLEKYTGKNAADIPQQFVPYKEVLEVYDAGLEVPDYVTLVWCDDNYGYIRRLSSEREQQRSGGAGVYYHISYWGRPHDYLWLASTSPALIYSEMQRAYKLGADKIWILNVGDIKPAEYLTEYFLDLAWNVNSYVGSSVFSHLQNWAAREFGEQNATEITAIMKEYYRLANIRKPEFMGWSQTEVRGYPRNNTPVVDSEYNPVFNNELNRRIENYLSLAERVKQLKPFIADGRKSAFYELVEYPVYGASLMNQKWLYAQLSHCYMDNDLQLAEEYAGKSIAAYNRIEQITKAYNSLENGKWNLMMDLAPRRLPVFEKPQFTGIDSLIHVGAILAAKRQERNTIAPVIARNAVQAGNIATTGMVLEGLGHSFSAIQMQENSELHYSFNIPQTGEAEIVIGAIPNHDVDGHGMKIAVSIDGQDIGEADYSVEGRSQAWKLNVLRGQAIVKYKHNFTETGTVDIAVKALTPYIILDQIMINFNNENVLFYEFQDK